MNKMVTKKRYKDTQRGLNTIPRRGRLKEKVILMKTKLWPKHRKYKIKMGIQEKTRRYDKMMGGKVMTVVLWLMRETLMTRLVIGIAVLIVMMTGMVVVVVVVVVEMDVVVATIVVRGDGCDSGGSSSS